MVADFLFMETELDIVRSEDWTRQPKELKKDVERVQESLSCR